MLPVDPGASWSRDCARRQSTAAAERLATPSSARAHQPVFLALDFLLYVDDPLRMSGLHRAASRHCQPSFQAEAARPRPTIAADPSIAGCLGSPLAARWSRSSMPTDHVSIRPSVWLPW